MKFRGMNRFATGYYRLIGSVHAGEPVQAEDTYLGDGHGKRDRLFAHIDRTIRGQHHDPTQREDSPPEPQQLPAEERPSVAR